MSKVYRRKKHEITETSENKKSSINTVDVSVVTDVNEIHIFLGLLLFRVCNVFLVQTWFVPDEYWQGPEIAHKMVFGYGHETWEWKEGIRGYTFPLIFAILFKCLQLLGADWPALVIVVPRLFQAFLSTTGEFFIYKFAKMVCSPGAAWWVMFCNLTSWFVFFCSTRTLTNTMETSLVLIGLYFWQLELAQINPSQNNNHTGLYKALIFASLSCLVRPTALIIWFPLGISKLWCSESRLNFALKHVIPVGVVTSLVSIGLDSLFYGKFIVVQYNFVYFNIMKNVGEIYGTHPWYWYLVQGIPVVLATHLVPLCVGLYHSGKSFKKWILIILINVFIYSLLSHKEFRFILPITPLLMCICGEGLHKVAENTTTILASKKHKEHSTNGEPKQVSFKGKMLVLVLIITNVPVALYTGLVHQRGTLDVMQVLGNQLQNQNNALFLMPCHSTPYYSYTHKDVKMRFLDCSPSMNTTYVDEADQFYNNPLHWLNKTYNASGPNESTLPTHIIMFDVLLDDIKRFLQKHKYTKCGKFFHSQFPSGRIGHHVILFCRISVNKQS